jgi:hypothetical protein
MLSFTKSIVGIRIRMDLVLLDPDLYWECGCGSRSREIYHKITNKPDFQPFKMVLYGNYVGMVYDTLSTWYSLFFMLKSNFL